MITCSRNEIIVPVWTYLSVDVSTLGSNNTRYRPPPPNSLSSRHRKMHLH